MDTGPSAVSSTQSSGGYARASKLGAALALVRQLTTVVGLLLIYYLLPLDRAQQPTALAVVLVGLLAVLVLAAWQIRSILRSARPLARGMETLASAVPLYLLVYATAYYLMALGTPGSFTQPLTRTDALYFTVTVFATVGFGDIAPVTEPARVAVTVQMVTNLLVLGVLLRAVTRAVQIGRARRGTEDDGRTEPQQ
jgi:voltage-gated potassium channel